MFHLIANIISFKKEIKDFLLPIFCLNGLAKNIQCEAKNLLFPININIFIQILLLWRIYAGILQKHQKCFFIDYRVDKFAFITHSFTDENKRDEEES